MCPRSVQETFSHKPLISRKSLITRKARTRIRTRDLLDYKFIEFVGLPISLNARNVDFDRLPTPPERNRHGENGNDQPAQSIEL